jgi:hypothetical protein
MSVSIRQVGVALAAAVALAVTPARAVAQGRQVLGTYTTSITSPQGAIKAVIVLKRDGATVGGTLSADGFPTIPVSNVVPSDTGVTLQGDSPDGAVMVSMKFMGPDKVAGKLNYQGMEMALDGSFAPEASGAAVSGVGQYDMKSSEPIMGAAEFPFTCLITRGANGALGGTCGNPDQGDVPVNTVTVAGNQVTLAGDTPVGPFKVVLTITGSAATGTLSVGAETAKAKGTYTPK